MPDYRIFCRNDLTLRPADQQDAQRLYEWRMDETTRAASLNEGAFPFAQHCQWLADSLNNPLRRLFIALHQNQPVGMVRADRDGDGWRLSWSVAPAARGQGLARPMVAALACQLDGPLHAQIKRDNLPSVRLAVGLGLVCPDPSAEVLDFHSQEPKA